MCVCICVRVRVCNISNNLDVNQRIINAKGMTRKSNVMYGLIHIDPVYIVVSISINIVILLNIRRSLLNQIMHMDEWPWIRMHNHVGSVISSFK